MSTGLTIDALRRLEEMDSEEPMDEDVIRQYGGNGSDDEDAAYDSDEERIDRLITPREMSEIEEWSDANKPVPAAPAPMLERRFTIKEGATAGLKKVTKMGSDPHDDSQESGPFMWYFAYGSNMNVAQLLTRIGAFEEKKLLYLPNYKLAFNKKVSLKPVCRLNSQNTAKCGFANVVESPGDRVYGIAYLVRESQIKKMDVYEGISSGHYFRVTKRCYDNRDFATDCEVYVACPQACADDLLPTEGYLSHLLGGRGLLPPEYSAMLMNQKTVKK